MKRIFTLCLVTALTLGFVACEEPQNNDQPNTEQNGNGENNGNEEENGSGENNEGNENVEVSPLVGTWQNTTETEEITRTQTYTFAADGTGSYHSLTEHPEHGGTSLTESISYRYSAEEQTLIITYIISGWQDTQTYTAILEGDTLTLSNEKTPTTIYTRIEE